MSIPISIDQLLEREYWTPGECARVLGHGRAFWAQAMDDGHVMGYRLRGRGRYILVSSARSFLANGPHVTGVNFDAARRARMKQFGVKIKAILAAQNGAAG